MKKFKALVWAVIICITSCLTYSAAAFNSPNQSDSIDTNNLSVKYFSDSVPSLTVPDSANIMADTLVISYDVMKDSLINAVTSYIKLYNKNCPSEIPESIVKYAIEYDIDICFMMSQSKVETVFGKAGIGRVTSRKSIFGVERRKYQTYGECVEHYVKLLRKSYLVNGKTEQNLMKRFVTKSGYRYATNPKYEVSISAAYKHIVKNTNIKELQQQIKQYLQKQ